jgi:hypothetical protein
MTPAAWGRSAGCRSSRMLSRTEVQRPVRQTPRAGPCRRTTSRSSPWPQVSKQHIWRGFHARRCGSRPPDVGPRLSDAVVDAQNAAFAGAVRTTVHRASRLHAVADDLALAMDAHGCERVNGAFETVECSGYPRSDDLKRLVVIIATDAALRHFPPPFDHQAARVIRAQAPRRRLHSARRATATARDAPRRSGTRRSRPCSS